MANIRLKDLGVCLREFFQSNLTPTKEDVIKWAEEQGIWRTGTVKCFVSQLKSLGYINFVDGKYNIVKPIPSNYTTKDITKEYNKYKYLKSLED